MSERVAGRPVVLAVIDEPAPRAELDAAVAERRLGRNEVVERAFRSASYLGSRIHVFAPLPSVEELRPVFSLVDLASFHDVEIVLHGVLGGGEERTAMEPIRRVENVLEGRGAFGTISGRSFAGTPEGRWDLVRRALHAIVRDGSIEPEAPRADTCFDAVRMAYGAGLADEDIVPIRIGDYAGIRGDFRCEFGVANPVWEWTGEEEGLLFPGRGESLRMLGALLTARGVPPDVAGEHLTELGRPIRAFDEGRFTSLTEVGLTVPVAFPVHGALGPLGEAVGRAGLVQRWCEGAGDAARAVREGGLDLVVAISAGGDLAGLEAAVAAAGGTLFPARGGDEAAALAPTVLELLSVARAGESK